MVALDHDVLIVGGGPAGLAAALILGRCLRRVLVCDTNTQRNRASHAIHGLLGQEGKPPARLLTEAREELTRYSSVTYRHTRISKLRSAGNSFIFRDDNGLEGQCRFIVIATGMRDILPDIPEIARYYGRSVHHCVYCDGFEYGGLPLIAYGEGDKGAALALMLRHWSDRITACTAGAKVSENLMQQLNTHRVHVVDAAVTRLIGQKDQLEAVSFADGQSIACNALFFATGCEEGADLSDQLGCARNDKGHIEVEPKTCETTVSGVYVVGDASRDVLLVAVAIAEGTMAGVAVNRAMLKQCGLL